MAGYLAGNVDKWIYIDIADQHPDSIRFIKDCEKAIGKKIQVLKSSQKGASEYSGDLEIPETASHHARTG